MFERDDADDLLLLDDGLGSWDEAEKGQPTIGAQPVLSQSSPDGAQVGPRFTSTQAPPSHEPVASQTQTERLFPGPAGLVRARGQKRASKRCKSPSKEQVNLKSLQLAKRTHIDSAFTLECPCWSKMKEDLSHLEQFLNLYHLDWIAEQTASNGIASALRIPLLAVKVRSVRMPSSMAQHPIAMVGDSTGKEVVAAINKEVLEAHSTKIAFGTVLVLQNAPLVVTGRNRCLTINLENISSLYYLPHNDAQAVAAEETLSLSEAHIRKLQENLQQRSLPLSSSKSDTGEQAETCIPEDLLDGLDEDALFGEF